MRRALALCLSALVACGSSSRGRAREEQEAARPLRVGVLVDSGVHGAELVACTEVFGRTRGRVERGMQVLTIAPTRMPLESSDGLRIVPDHGFRGAPALDLLVVPSGVLGREREAREADLVAWVRETGRGADWVLALGEGSFLLARAGLLDGRRVTAAPAARAELARSHPAVEVLEGFSFVHDGALVSSRGGAPSYEAALYVCERLYGSELARSIAAELGMDWRLEHVDWFGPGSERSLGSGLAR